MGILDYIITGYTVVVFGILWVVIRKAKKYAASCGHKWYEMWDHEKYIAYLKTIGCDFELEEKKEN